MNSIRQIIFKIKFLNIHNMYFIIYILKKINLKLRIFISFSIIL